MKVHLCFAGIVLLGVVAPAGAADSEADRLKQAQGLFQPATAGHGDAGGAD